MKSPPRLVRRSAPLLALLFGTWCSDVDAQTDPNTSVDEVTEPETLPENPGEESVQMSEPPEESHAPESGETRDEPVSPDANEEDEADSSDSSEKAVAQTTDSSSAQEDAPPDPKPTSSQRVDRSKVPWTHHQKRVDLGGGAVIGWILDPAFDLFQSKNAYLAWEARAALGLWASGPMSLAVTANYNATATEGDVRGTPSSLTYSRMHLGGEARYHIVPRIYSYARLDLGAFVARSRIGETGSPTRLQLDGAGLSGAVNLGAAVRVAGSADGRVRSPRVHLFTEGGVGYASPLSLHYEMAPEGALRPAPVHLGKLSAGGPRIALGATVSY